ncbi:MAG: OmpA family protein [Syntrophaceae bacterium]|nr:OmpA family protein [Syntrophaceae bacterium]
MKKLLCGIVVLLVLAAASPGLAEVRPGTFSVTPFIGGYVFDNSQHLKNAPVYGVRFGYDLARYFGVEATLDYVRSEFSAPWDITKSDLYNWTAARSDKADVFNYRLEGLFYLLPQYKVVPYLAAGIGGQSINYPGVVENRSKFLVDVGAGVKWFITERLALRGDVRFPYVFDNSKKNLEYTLGLSFLFGGEKPAPPPPPPPVEPKVEVAPPPPPPPPPEPVKEMKEEAKAEQTATEKEMLEKGRATINVQFDTNKAIVKKKYHDEIAKFADVINRHPEIKVVIEGHTDNVGGKAFNQRLSEKRAKSVVKYMVDKFKVDKDRLSAKGYGLTQPIADNKTKEGRQKNRRVDAVVEYIIQK